MVNLCEKAAEDPVTTGIIHMGKSLKPGVEGCAFVKVVLTNSVSVLQLLSDGNLDLTHSWIVFILGLHRVVHCTFEEQDHRF